MNIPDFNMEAPRVSSRHEKRISVEVAPPYPYGGSCNFCNKDYADVILTIGSTKINLCKECFKKLHKEVASYNLMLDVAELREKGYSQEKE